VKNFDEGSKGVLRSLCFRCHAVVLLRLRRARLD
jgi:hypothetical protein